MTEQVAEPATEPGSWAEFVVETTPGGAVVFQFALVVIVYASWMFRRRHTVQSLLLGAVILVLTPWITVIFGVGDVVGAVINSMNVALGAYVYKYYFDRTESS